MRELGNQKEITSTNYVSNFTAPSNSIFPVSTHLYVNAMLVTTYIRTFNKDATRAKECANIPPPPGGKNAKCRIFPFKKSNCNIICIN